MKKHSTIIGLMLIGIISAGLMACSESQEVNEDITKPELIAPSQSETNNESGSNNSEAIDFMYEVESNTLSADGIEVYYPMLVRTNDPNKADILNDLIAEDIEGFVNNIIEDAPDSKLTIDASYEYSESRNTLISICYQGNYYSEGGAYPTNFYHTINVNKVSGMRVPLFDLFIVDDHFTESIQYGLYTPYTDDLNLEDAGVDVAALVSEQYTVSQLTSLFSDPNADYVVQDDAITLSIPVPHVVGDHLELSLLYDWFNGNIREEHIFWEDYMFLTEDQNEYIDEEGDGWQLYINPRFNYSLSYPDIYESYEEPDNGDGIYMTTLDGRYTLRIWASYNIFESNGFSLYEEAKKNYAYITNDYADEYRYSLTYEGGLDGEAIEFVENCYVTPNAQVYYIMSYPMVDKNNFDAINESMQAELYID
jgi:hypothetical protein